MCAVSHRSPKASQTASARTSLGLSTARRALAPGYKYSSAFLAMANWTWSPATASPRLSPPRQKTIPGNRMGVFQGIAERDEQDLLAYLAAQK